jgi:hypothetical protein
MRYEGENSMVIGPATADEAPRGRIVDEDAAYDARDLDAEARTQAIAAKVPLMLAAAREQVAAPPAEAVAHPSGWGYHFAADPVAEWLADDATRQATQARLVRYMVRAMALPPGDERDVLLALAQSKAEALMRAAVESRAWDMAKAAMRREGEA